MSLSCPPGGLAPQECGEGAVSGASQGQLSAEEGSGTGDTPTGTCRLTLPSACFQIPVASCITCFWLFPDPASGPGLPTAEGPIAASGPTVFQVTGSALGVS